MTNKLLKSDEFINTKLVNQKSKCYEELNKYIKGDYNNHIMNNLENRDKCKYYNTMLCILETDAETRSKFIRELNGYVIDKVEDNDVNIEQGTKAWCDGYNGGNLPTDYLNIEFRFRK